MSWISPVLLNKVCSLDVRKRHLAFCYNGIGYYRRYVQSKGHVVGKNSMFMFMGHKDRRMQVELKGSWIQNENLVKKSMNMLAYRYLHTQDVFEGGQGGEKRDTEYAIGNHIVYSRKIPLALSSPFFEAENSSLYGISMMLLEPRDNPGSHALQHYWFDGKKGFGIILPRLVPKVLPEIKLFTRAGGILINLKFICCLDFIPENAIGYHQFIFGMCSEKFVNTAIEFDFYNPKVSKGILVPLKYEHFDNIANNEKVGKLWERLIDFDTLENCQYRDETILKNSVIHKTYLDEKQNKCVYYVTDLSTGKAGDIMVGSKTYEQHYLEKYNRVLDPLSGLLEAVPVSTKVSFIENLSSNEFNPKTSRLERLVPELCTKVFSIDAHMHQQMMLLPYILYYYECILNTDELRRDISNKIGISCDYTQSNALDRDLNYPASETCILDEVLCMSREIDHQTPCPSVVDIIESITSRQSLFPYDYEQLEMLGDSFLKLAVTIYLYYRYPSLAEGELAIERMKSIENKNLFRIAEKVGIQNIVLNSQFGNVNENNKNKNSVTVWLPPGYVRAVEKNNTSDMAVPYQEVRKKTLADCIEALIGVYFKTGGINLALKFMQDYLGLDVLFSKIVQTDESCKVNKKKPSFYADYPLPDNAISDPAATYQDAEELFKDWDFSHLEEIIGYKFCDCSYLLQAMKHESYHLNSVTNCYERLEFLGDAVIDFLITLHIYHNKTGLDPGELTSIRSALVNNNTFALLAVKNTFDTHIKHLIPDLDCNLSEFRNATKFGEDLELFNVCFKNPFIIIPKDSEEGYHAPKILGDVFEAIVGAVFLDCRMDLAKVWGVIYPLMEKIIGKYMEDIPLNPVREFIEKYPDAKWTYEELDGVTVCTAHFAKGRTIQGMGRNKKMAKATASWKAVHPE